MCVSALDRMVRRYEAVSLGLKVDGTIRYSPGFSASSSITSRAFTCVLLWATAAFLLKNVSGNFPLCDLYCNTENQPTEGNMINEKVPAEVSVWREKVLLTSSVTLKGKMKNIVICKLFQ